MRILVALLCSLLLTSCSTQFTYRHLDWIILWYSDDYLELNEQQDALFTQHVELTLLWHRESELPRYREHLLELDQHLDKLPLPMNVLRYHYDQVLQHWYRIRHHLGERLAPLASELNYKQKRFLFAQLETRNHERIEGYQKLSQEERKERHLERWYDRLSELVGSLNNTQRHIIENHIDLHYDLTIERVEYLQRYQHQLKQVMNASVNSSELQAVMTNPESFKTKKHHILLNQNRMNTIAMLHAVSAHLTSEQVTHLKERIQDYVQIIDELTTQDS